MDDQRKSIANLPSLLLPKGLPPTSKSREEKALVTDNRMQHQTQERCNNLKQHGGHQTVLVDHKVVGQDNQFHSEADDRKWKQTRYISPSLSSSTASIEHSGGAKLTPTTLFLLLQVMLLLAYTSQAQCCVTKSHLDLIILSDFKFYIILFLLSNISIVLSSI